MNRTKRNLIYALILLVGAVLGCRREAGPVVDKVIEAERIAREQAARRAVHAALDEATKKRVVESLEYAAKKGQNTSSKYDELLDKEPTFGNFIRELKDKEKKELRDCLIKEAVVAAVPDSVRETGIIKNCFGPLPSPSP